MTLSLASALPFSHVQDSSLRAACSLAKYVGNDSSQDGNRLPLCHLSDELRLLVLAVMQTDDAVMIASGDGRILYTNPAFERVTGYSSSEAFGCSTNLLNSGKHPTVFFAELWQTIRSGDVFRGLFTNRHKDGGIFYEEKTITPIRDGAGQITHFVSTGRDVSDRIRAEARLEHLANKDVLTGLPNRHAFISQLAEEILRCQREVSGISLLHLDLDRFKKINDTLGHNTGDGVLTLISERLVSIVGEQGGVARLGGDEFAILLKGVKQAGEIELLARNIIASFHRPFDVFGKRFFVNACIGIASYPNDSDDVESLMKHADIAMFHAKSSGRAAIVSFSSVMEGGMLEDLSMETSLHSALENDEFEVVYQPIVNPADQSTVAVEALLRWHSPQHGSVPPSRFIPMLEATGLIIPVGRWVLETACKHIAAEVIAHSANVVLAVNLSGWQFRETGLVDAIRKILHSTGFPPQQLELEITESILIEDASQSAATLDALKALGVRLAIDDFGTGYSSLSYLRRFPIDTLKIDRSFVVEMESSPDAVVIVRAIVNLAHSLGLEVVGEGVETAAQLAYLSELGCQKVQGYLFSPPVSLCHLQSTCQFGVVNAV